MGVIVTPKSKMGARSASSGEIVKVLDLDLSESSNKSPEPLLDGPDTSEYMPVLLLFEFSASGKNDTILDFFVTATSTMHV